MHRINITLDDSAWLALQDLPKGERSKLLSAAIKQVAETRQRLRASNLMDDLRKKMPKVKTKEIVGWIRQDRTR